MVESKNYLVIAGAIIAAALIVALALNFGSNTGLNESQPGKISIQIPDYLTKDSSGKQAASSAFGDGIVSFAADSSGEQKRLVSVSGTVTKTEAPDKANVVFSVQTLDKLASKSQSDNAELAEKVMAALEGAGIAKADIKTSSYNLNEEFQWNGVLEKSESIGYRTTNSIQVTLNDLSKVGSVIDVAVQAGANSVSSVSFELSSQKVEALRTAALKEAAENAKAKAESIASGLGIAIGQVFSASESSNYYAPVYRDFAMSAGASESKATTPITPGDIEFSATVSVQFEIQ